MSKSVDTKLAKALKPLLGLQAPALESTLSGQAREIVSQRGDQGLEPAVRGACLYAGKTRFEHAGPEALLEAVSKLSAATLSKSAEILFVSGLDRLAGANPNDVAALAPSARAIDALCKKHKSLSAEIERCALQTPKESRSLVALQWYASKVPPARLAAIVPALQSRVERGDQTKPMREALAAALTRDKSGAVLGGLLETTAKQDVPFAPLLAVLASDAAILTAAVSLLPKLAATPSADLLPSFSESLAALLPGVPEKKRLALSRASLSSVAALLAAGVRKPSARSVALAVCSWLPRLDAQGRDLAGFVLPSRGGGASVQEGGQERRLSPRAAALLGQTVDKLWKGFDPAALIEALAVNNGLRFFHERGDLVEFDLGAHEDCEAGLSPGDRAEVVHPGLKQDEDVVLRAAVRRAKP